MPIYEYSCEACGATFETIQRITEPPTETCEVCGAGPVHKLISQSTFILKGSGWYVTDYGKGNDKKNGKTSASAPEDNGGSSHHEDTPKPAEKKADKASKDSSSDASASAPAS